MSLPSLSVQLTHITLQMSIYYGNGLHNAVDLLTMDRSHIAHEYKRDRYKYDAAAYIKSALLSHVRLYGGHGAWVEQRKSDEDGIHIFQDYTRTMKDFKNGKLAYKPTPLGGCASTQPCDKKFHEPLTACWSCKDSIINPVQVHQAITIQEQLVASLAPGSIEYNTENAELDALTERLNRLKEKA
ncbi:hypothetical protein FQZ97_802310 [compost metagenome]